ncbi:SAC3 family protein C isoform X3 [Mercurialis annua]|uniref:SAC3 family protein C isoform X3 n=1 Tax=Mercurialis annua TaxID=3986 RepID=UPI0021607BD7|nr:SAC3 family protein C isoform X3 [Mercurialis annua]
MDLKSRKQTRKPNISEASDSSSSSRSESNLPISYNRRNYKFSSFNSGNISIASNGKINIESEEEEEEEEEEVTEDDSSPVLMGTCPNMCPEGERSQRERLRDLAVFERLHGNPGRTSPSLAVKKFCRTISSKHVQASDVRPLPVLEETLSYLLNLVDSTGHPFEVVHDFIFDRTRSIRQDLVMQSIVNDIAVNMYEKMVRFHVESHHKLKHGGSNENISSVHYLNMEQLIKALTSLYNLYDANRDPDSSHENEAQFRSLYVLLHLDSRSQPMGESLSLWFRRVPHSIMQSKEMHFARSVLRFFRMDNYKRFFCTVASEASYIQYCIIERYINEVRVQSLACINNVGYKLHPYPLAHLSNLLIMKESDLEVLCNACGLETFEDEMGNKFLPTKQTTFSLPKGGFQKFNFPGLERFER